MEQKRKLQMVQLMILKDIHDVCVRHNLKYYLIGGTLIGAVRHKGFIPWDDDIDIAMYREDLDALEKIMETHADKYFVQNFDTDKHYTRYITKIRLNGTAQIESGFENIDMHKGIFVDIFPLDKVHNKNGIGLYIRGYVLRALFAFKTIRHVKDKETSRFKKILMKVFRPFTKLIPEKHINNLFDYVCTMSKNKNCEYTTSFASGYRWKKQLVENTVYGNGILKTFEGFEFYVPDNYDFLLRQIFGNYMQLPPLDKRTSGHDVVFIDFGSYD